MNTINATNSIRILSYPADQAEQVETASVQGGSIRANSPSPAQAPVSAEPQEHAGWDSDDPVLDGLLQKIRYSDLPLSEKQKLAEEIQGKATSLPSDARGNLVYEINRQLSAPTVDNRIFKFNFQEIARYLKELTEFDLVNTELFSEIKQLYQTSGLSA